LSLVRLAAAIGRFPAAQGISDRILTGTFRVGNMKVARKELAQSERERPVQSDVCMRDLSISALLSHSHASHRGISIRKKWFFLPTEFPILSQAGNNSRNACNDVVVEERTFTGQASDLVLMRL
jgi:hypothetical protein